MTTPIPAPVNAPAETASWEVWDIYLRRVTAQQQSLQMDVLARWAESQAALVGAVRAQVDRMLEATAVQREMVAAMRDAAAAQRELVAEAMAPGPDVPPGGANANIARALLESMLASGRTGDSLAAEAQAQLRRYRSLYPLASTGAPT
jgi:hypothetical protein